MPLASVTTLASGATVASGGATTRTSTPDSGSTGAALGAAADPPATADPPADAASVPAPGAIAVPVGDIKPTWTVRVTMLDWPYVGLTPDGSVARIAMSTLSATFQIIVIPLPIHTAVRLRRSATADPPGAPSSRN